MHRVPSLLLIALTLSLSLSAGADPASAIRLPDGVAPSIGAWFWYEDCLQDDCQKQFIDMFADHSVYDLLTTSFRMNQREVVEPAVHDAVKAAVAYAETRGLAMAVDLDVRLARRAFQAKYPDEQQEMIRLRTIDLAATGEVELAVKPKPLSDHMTGRTTPYLSLRGRLVRAYSYQQGTEGIDPDSVRDITDRCIVRTATEEEVSVAIPCNAESAGRTACLVVAFQHLTPAVFAPHLLEFQRSIVSQYADIPMAGIMKDEWGFPPYHGGCPEKNDFWYSPYLAEAYADVSGGRDFVRDCLLMYAGERGRHRERVAAINRLRELGRTRNAAIEAHFYALAKEFYGPNAYVVTHPTWLAYPGTSEFMKNGLDWWAARRDLAQTDEYAPFCTRTALAKKWGSPVWYNQFYDTQVSAYEESLWSHAMAGGRINYHPIYPNKEEKTMSQRMAELLSLGLVRGESRIRLIPLISSSPVQCPVAVVFGHPCAMNWAGPAYDDVGIALTDALWRAGYYTDLIPSSEIADGAMSMDSKGRVQYGTQSYEAVVLYHPEFDTPATAEYFAKAANGETALYRVGEWTTGFDGSPFEGTDALPQSMTPCPDARACAAQVIECLKSRNVAPFTPAESRTRDRNGTACPGRSGRYALTDGTVVVLAGQQDTAGDPIVDTFDVNGHQVTVDAIGVAAVRLSEDGELEALAAGGLKRFTAGGVAIELPGRVDVAIWTDAGAKHGVVQGLEGAVPPQLLTLTEDWKRLALPTSMP